MKVKLLFSLLWSFLTDFRTFSASFHNYLSASRETVSDPTASFSSSHMPSESERFEFTWDGNDECESVSGSRRDSAPAAEVERLTRKWTKGSAQPTRICRRDCCTGCGLHPESSPRRKWTSPLPWWSALIGSGHRWWRICLRTDQRSFENVSWTEAGWHWWADAGSWECRSTSERASLEISD